MPRSYRNIKMYEKEIIEMKRKGIFLREIGEKLGFTHKQVYNFITRYNANQRKLEAGASLKGIEIYPCPKRSKNQNFGNGK